MKRYFITGLLIWAPLGITLWVLSFILGMMDQSIMLLPNAWQPRALVGFNIPGVGAIMTLLVVFITGLLTANFIGQRLVRWWEALLHRIPVVRSIYQSVKQISDTVFSPSGQAFRQAALVQYPRQGSWTIGFLTGTLGGEIAERLGDNMVSLYVPTTPNPTSGFFLMVPKSDVLELDMSVEDALKYLISMGVVAPTAQQPVNLLKQPDAATYVGD
ncbi:MAG: Putative membrane anchored protein [Fluviibacter phosphoraccumulans EoVTN8]